ncbi:MAG: hypothetical protein AB9891_06885 [Anaerolineaceae bacterium]
MDERYIENRKQIEQFFIPENIKPGSGMSVVSPSRHFRIEINHYLTLPNRWEYSRGIVTNIGTGKVVADVKRNYDHFWYTWVQHPNGNEYLLCGEDYQGYSVLNLNTGNYMTYFPEEGYQGVGFCWTDVHPSPDGLVLAVDGCYWACPYELVVFDFRNPENLPYPELARFEALDGCDGWKDNDTFVLRREITIRKSDGVDYDSLSEQEQEILENESTLLGHRIETIQFNKPSF